MDLYLRSAPGNAKDPWLRSLADRYGPLVPEKPTELTAAVISPTQRALSWTAPFNGGSSITGYKVEVENPTGGGWTTLSANTGSATPSYDATVTPGRNNFRVSAINAIGTGPTSIPSDIPVKDGLLFDLHADNISQADNTALATWSDRSGIGNHAISGAGAIFREVGGLKYVSFNGTTHYFILPPYLGELGTVFFVGRLDDTTTRHNVLGAKSLSTSSPLGAFYFQTREDASHGTARSYFGDNGPDYSTGAPPPSTSSLLASGRTAPTSEWFVQTGVIDGDFAKVRVYGTTVGTDTATGQKLNVDGPIVVGAGYINGALTEFWDGDIRRIMAFGRALTVEEIAAVEAYIAEEEGLALAEFVAEFSGAASGLILALTDASTTPPGTTITSWAWDFDDGAQTSSAQNPIVSGLSGTFDVTLTVGNSDGNFESVTHSFTLAVGSSSPPYDLPTEKIAGRFLIALDSTIDWTGKAGVVFSTLGRPFLDYYKVPTPAAGTECRVKNYEITDHADQPTRTMHADLALTGKAGSLSILAVNSFINQLSGSYAAAVFGAREVWIQNPIGDPDSTDPADWKPRFHGYLDDPKSSWSGNVALSARDIASALQVAYKGPEVWIGVEGGTITLADAIQAVLDATTRAGMWPLKVVGDLTWDISAFPLRNVDDVLQLIGDMARQRGAVVRWWPDEGTERFQLTLFILQLDKEGPDFTFGANGVKDAPDSGSDTLNVRNDLYLDVLLEGQDTPTTIHRPPTQAEVDAYRLKPLWIGTEATKHIKDLVAAGVMMDSIEGAVRLPATIGSRIISPRNSGIEINSLLLFGSDARIAHEDLLVYCSGWTERVAAAGEEIADEIETMLRNGPAGQIYRWFRRIAGKPVADTTVKLPPTWKYDRRTIYNPIYDTYKLVAFCKIETHGLAVTEIRAQTKLPESAWLPFEPPARVTGAWSEVHERALAIGEFEHEVALLGGDAISSIGAEIDVEGIGVPITLFEVNGDANNDPDVVDVRVTGTNAEVIADDDSKSVHVVKISGPGSAYSASFDSNDHIFAVPVPASSEWELEGYSKNTLIADPDDKVSEPFPFTVSNTGEPTISLMVEPPDDGSGTMTIETTSTSQPAGYRARYLMRYTTYPSGGGGGVTTSETDITPQMSPSPLVGGLPASPTTYYLSTGFVRNDADPEGDIAVEIRAEVLNASNVVVSGTGLYPFVAPWPYRIPT